MTNEQCESVRFWLRQPNAQPVDHIDHIAQCVTCRGALVALLAEGGSIVPIPATSCAECQDDLASYVDAEVAEGAQAAMQRFPHMWWHVLVCPSCAETYRLIHSLIDAAATGELGPMPDVAVPIAAHPVLRLPPVRLPRPFLHAIFAPRAALGTAWNVGEDDYVIAEEDFAEHRLTISVRHHRSDACTIHLVVAPPIARDVVLRFGETIFRSRFDDRGEATIADVPVALLTQAQGPDMELLIVSDEEPA